MSSFQAFGLVVIVQVTVISFADRDGPKCFWTVIRLDTVDPDCDTHATGEGSNLLLRLPRFAAFILGRLSRLLLCCGHGNTPKSEISAGNEKEPDVLHASCHDGKMHSNNVISRPSSAEPVIGRKWQNLVSRTNLRSVHQDV